MDPQHFPVHGQTGCLPEPGCLPERRRIPLTPYRFGFHRPVDTSFLSYFNSPPLPHLPTFTAPFTNGCVVLDSLPPENEESYAKGWHSGFVEESQTAEAESSQVSDVEAIRNKATGQSESYGSIEFSSHAAAERASFGSGDKRQDDSAEFSVFVANLAAEVTDYVLEQTFKVYYTSVKVAKVVTDRTTGRSKGYGFVRFADKDEQMRSLTEMNGHCCLTRPMRIAPASTGPASIPKATFQSFLGTQNESAPNKSSTSNEQDPFAWMVQEHLDSNQRPHAAGNMLPSFHSEYNGSYEAYGYVVTNRFSFEDGKCYQQHQKRSDLIR